MPPIDAPAAAPTHPIDALLAVLMFVLPFVALGLMAVGQNTIGYVFTGVLIVAVLAGAARGFDSGK